MKSLPTPTSPQLLAIHLADRALTPLISSARSPSSTPDANSQAHTQAREQAQALSSLTTAAITAYDSASRLGLGRPQRIMIGTQSEGPVILHSFLNPPSPQRDPSSRSAARGNGNGKGIVEQAREELRPLTGTTENSSAPGGMSSDAAGMVNGGFGGLSKGIDADDGEATEDESLVQPPPLLIASVVAPSGGDSGEARRAAARLERMGREFQREWIREQEEHLDPVGDGEDG